MLVLLEYIAVGLAGGSILIFLAKGVMAQILQKDLAYYQDEFDRGGEQDG